MIRKVTYVLGIVSLIMLAGGLQADDTDIYSNDAPPPPGSEPMVMFSLDYRPNLGSTVCQNGECQFLVDGGYLPAQASYTFFDMLRGSLRAVMDQLEGLRIGLMVNHDYKNNCEGGGINPQNGCSNGSYMALGFKHFNNTAAGLANKEAFHTFLANMPTPQGNQSHSYQGKELFFEFFRYLTGQGIYNGHTGYLDYDGNDNQNLDVNFPPISWDPNIESGANYETPFIPGATCNKIYTVNMMFQVANQDSDSDAAINEPLASGGFGWGNRRNTEFDDVIAYLNGVDLSGASGKQNVTSYFMLKAPFFTNNKGVGYAQAGGTGTPLELTEDPEELVATLIDIFKQILAVSTTFVAASIPVNSFNRAEVLDNVYLGLFQPNEDARPYWFGNVKKLKIAGLGGSGALFLADADGDPAIAADGRIRFDALTYWTNPNAADVQAFDVDKGEVTGKDGRTVFRGGGGHKTPGFQSGAVNELNSGSGGRVVYYDSNDTTLSAFNANAATASAVQTDLGAADATEALELIKYARGIDVLDEDGDTLTDDTRPWLMGSALHSRPLPLNYGARTSFSPGNPEVYILTGTNDGMVRMFRNTPAGATPGGSETGSGFGEEVWAFAPRSVMGVHKYLHDNAFTSGVKHSYGVDDAPVLFIKENGNGTIEAGEKVWTFFGLRRGGRALYGMDLSNPTSPDLLWVIEGGDTGFEDLGYTFSTPTVGQVRVGVDNVPVLIFGGGYDMGYDDLAVPAGDPLGNSIFVVNAETGALIKRFTDTNLLDPVPSPVSATDLDGDGLTDRIYTGDLGGNVWRADLVNTGVPADWQITRIGSFGRRAGEQDRRFFHKPDVVKSKDANGNFDAVLLGSGNRTDPLTAGVDNFFYMIKDKNTLTPPPPGSLPFEQGDLEDITACTDCASVTDLANGWELELTAGGEKNLATALTLGGVVFFTTYIPPGPDAPGAECGPSEGGGRLYAIGLQSGNPLVNLDKPIWDQQDPGDPDDRWGDLASGGIPAQVVAIPPNRILRPDLQIQPVPVSTRWRTFWYPNEEPGQ
jgi:type IV pilus assembly protein PilY1